MKFAKILLLSLLSACANQGHTPLASGKVININKDSVTLQCDKQFYFLKLGESQKLAFRNVREGQKIQLFGRVVSQKSNGESESKTIDPYEIALDDGRRIKL